MRLQRVIVLLALGAALNLARAQGFVSFEQQLAHSTHRASDPLGGGHLVRKEEPPRETYSAAAST